MKVAIFVTMLALCSACSGPSQARPSATEPSSSTTVSRAVIPEATSTPVAKCDDADTEALVRRFVAEFNASAIDKVDALFVPRGAGFRFLSTPRTGAETDRARVVPILQEFYQAGERITEIRLSNVVGASNDGIGGALIRYGTNGAIKFQIHCATQLIAAVAWDVVEQPALKR